jgi:hypothetical protein
LKPEFTKVCVLRHDQLETGGVVLRELEQQLEQSPDRHEIGIGLRLLD